MPARVNGAISQQKIKANDSTANLPAAVFITVAPFNLPEMTAKPTYDQLRRRVRELEKEAAERQKSEKRLKQQSERKFRSVAQTAKDAIILADKEGRIVFWNTAARDMFGYEQGEISGRPLTELMPRNFRRAHKKGLSTYPSRGESRIIGQTVEMVGLTKEGREFPIELSVSFWKTNKEIYYAGIIRDISERKQFEKEREKLILDLQSSLAKVKTLSGLLPICASCKKIRDDKGYWNQIEAYIHKHSDATFSHGICPDCAAKLYPDYSTKKDSN